MTESDTVLADEIPRSPAALVRYTNAQVETTDKVAKAETPEDRLYTPDSNKYAVIELLENGWVRCVAPEDDGISISDQDNFAVDCYPPQLVNGVWSNVKAKNGGETA